VHLLSNVMAHIARILRQGEGTLQVWMWRRVCYHLDREGEPMVNLSGVVVQLQRERARIARELNRLDEALSALNGGAGKNHGARLISAAGRARIAAAQRARWAKVRANSGQKVVRMPKKRTLSVAARKKIAAAQRARWAKVKSEKTTA